MKKGVVNVFRKLWRLIRKPLLLLVYDLVRDKIRDEVKKINLN
jgi:hypothetical protein